jgi:hypothetical protein
MNNNLSIIFPNDLDQKNLISLVNKIIEKKSKHYILWSLDEGIEPSFDEYLQWNYFINDNHCENVKTLEKVLLEHNIILYVLTCSDDRSNVYKNVFCRPIQNVKFIFWPTYYLHYTYYGLKDIRNKKKQENNIDKLFLCLNGKYRYHRAVLIDKLCQNNLMNEGLISWNAIYENKCVNKYDFKYWDGKILKIDDFDFEYKQTEYSELVLNNTTYFNLVTETTEWNGCLMITEKTYKPILYEQPFLCVGSMYQNRILEKYNFKLYDEIFDYNFDVQSNFENRIDGIVYNVSKLRHKNLKDLYEITKEKVFFNKNNALSIIKNDPYIPKEIVDMFKTYNKDFKDGLKTFNLVYNNQYVFENNIKLDVIDEIFKYKI